MHRKFGFTVVELLVAIVIIGVLATLTFFGWIGYTERAKTASLISDVTNASRIIEAEYSLSNSIAYATSTSSLNGGRGLVTSSGNTLTYTYDNNSNPAAYCVSVSNGSKSYMISSTIKNASYGICRSGIVTKGLALDLDAGEAVSYGGSGNTWYDISGNGRNFNWSPSVSYVSGPISYFNTLGNGATGPASNAFGIDNSSGYTIFMAFYQNTLAGAYSFKWYSSNGSGAASRGIGVSDSWSEGTIYYDQSGCCTAGTNRTAAAMLRSTGYWNIHAFRSNSSNERSIWQNGVMSTTNTTAQVAMNLNSTPVTLAKSDELSPIWDARVSQILVYNRALSDTEMTTTYNAMKAKYGL